MMDSVNVKYKFTLFVFMWPPLMSGGDESWSLPGGKYNNRIQRGDVLYHSYYLLMPSDEGELHFAPSLMNGSAIK